MYILKCTWKCRFIDIHFTEPAVCIGMRIQTDIEQHTAWIVTGLVLHVLDGCEPATAWLQTEQL